MARPRPPRGAVIAAGEAHTLVRERHHRVLSFGWNHDGQLGVDEIDRSLKPVAARAEWQDRAIVSLAAGQAHSLAVDKEGTVWAWGRNVDFQLGNDDQNGSWLPRRVPIRIPCDGVAAGAAHSFALASSGALYAWGKHSHGQLGIGGTFPEDAGTGPLIETPTRVARNIALIAGGGRHSVAATIRGNVLAWGSNLFGQCGQAAAPLSPEPGDEPIPSYFSVPTEVRTAERTRLLAASVAAGMGFSVVATPEGKVFTFGGITTFGAGTIEYDHVPREVPGLVRVTDVAAPPSGNFYLARTSSGRVWRGGPGVAPQELELPEKIIAIAAGTGHVVALDTRGGVWTWGENFLGQTGLNSTATFIHPPRQPLTIQL